MYPMNNAPYRSYNSYAKPLGHIQLKLTFVATSAGWRTPAPKEICPKPNTSF